jgi:hypothetical protein
MLNNELKRTFKPQDSNPRADDGGFLVPEIHAMQGKSSIEFVDAQDSKHYFLNFYY